MQQKAFREFSNETVEKCKYNKDLKRLMKYPRFRCHDYVFAKIFKHINMNFQRIWRKDWRKRARQEPGKKLKLYQRCVQMYNFVHKKAESSECTKYSAVNIPLRWNDERETADNERAEKEELFLAGKRLSRRSFVCFFMFIRERHLWSLHDMKRQYESKGLRGKRHNKRDK